MPDLSPLDHAILAGAAARLSPTELAAQQNTTASVIWHHAARLRAMGHDVSLPGTTAHPVTRGLHDATLVALDIVGMSCPAMGRQMGCDAATVAKRLRLIRVAQGLTERKVDARTVRYALVAGPMDRLMPRQRVAWTAAQTHADQTQAARAAGMSHSALRTHLCLARRRMAEVVAP